MIKFQKRQIMLSNECFLLDDGILDHFHQMGLWQKQERPHHGRLECTFMFDISTAGIKT